MSTYTGAFAFAFKFPLSANIGWGLATNTPVDRRQSETIITVLSTKLGYKFLDKKLNITIGGNYVFGMKGKNGFWDSGEEFILDTDSTLHDYNRNNSFDFYTTDEWDDFGIDNIQAIDGNNDNDYEDDVDIAPDTGEGNGEWDPGELLIEDYNNDGKWNDYPADKFIDKIEMDNWKISLKGSIKYKIPEKNLAFDLKLDYAKSMDKLKNVSEQKPPQYKAKFSIKYNF